MGVFQRSQFKDKPEAYIDELLQSENLSTEGTREEKITRVVEASYPIRQLPTVRSSSVRGIVLGSFVDSEGRPSRGVREEEIVQKLLESGRVSTREQAVAAFKLYKRDLVRYYGYTLHQVEGIWYVVPRRVRA